MTLVLQATGFLTAEQMEYDIRLLVAQICFIKLSIVKQLEPTLVLQVPAQ